MICQDELPISFVENRGFKQLVSYLAPWYKIPVKKTVKLRIDALYDIEKQKLLEEMSTIDDIALTTDCWSSRATESYVTVTAHYITPAWKHVARNITTEQMERHTILNLQDKIDKILTEWEIKPKCRAIVHDNAANIVGAARNFPYSINCFAHSLQLVLNKILCEQHNKVIIDKCSNIVGHFKHSNVAMNALSNKQSQLGLEKHKLVQSVKTRWNSTFLMLKRLIEQREAVIGVLSDRTVTTRNQAGQLMLSEDEWTLIENIANVLQPFELVTTLLSSDSQPTISIVMPILQSLVQNFLSKTNDEDTDDVTRMKNQLLQEMRSRFKDVLCSDYSVTGSLEISVLDISTFLDPRFKNTERFLGSIIQAKRLINNLLQNEEDAVEEVIVNPAKKSALDILFPSDSVDSSNFNTVDSYYSESAIPKNMCPLQWWKNNQQKYPKLSKLARRYLCIPATSTASERAFSKAGNIVTAKRSCLKPDNVKKICFLSSNSNL